MGTELFGDDPVTTGTLVKGRECGVLFTKSGSTTNTVDFGRENTAGRLLAPTPCFDDPAIHFFRESQHIPGCSTHTSWDRVNRMEPRCAPATAEAPGAQFAFGVTPRKDAATENRFRHIDYSAEHPTSHQIGAAPTQSRSHFGPQGARDPLFRIWASRKENRPCQTPKRHLLPEEEPLQESRSRRHSKNPNLCIKRSPSPRPLTLVPPDRLMRSNSVRR